MRQTLEEILNTIIEQPPYPYYNMGLLPDEPGYNVDQLLANHEARDNWRNARKMILEWAAYKVKDARPSTYIETEDMDDIKWQGRVEAVDEYSRNLFTLLKREGYER